MNEVSKIVEKISNLPEEITEQEYLIIPSEHLDKILTPNRKKIIELLSKQNPLTKEKIDELLRFDTHKDLVILKHLNLVKTREIDKDPKHNIVTLNRKVSVI